MLAYVAFALANGIQPGNVGQNIGGGISGFENGISATGKPPTPAVDCGAGVLDMSTGCALPIRGYGRAF